jgi:hypothetical protein
MNERICDFGFAICDLAACRGRDARGGHNGRGCSLKLFDRYAHAL